MRDIVAYMNTNQFEITQLSIEDFRFIVSTRNVPCECPACGETHEASNVNALCALCAIEEAKSV